MIHLHETKTCKFEDCKCTKIKAKGLCSKHYEYNRTYGKCCLVDECENQSYAKGYCRKHYKRQYKGQDLTKRSAYDKNEFVIVDEVAYIDLYDAKGNVKLKCMVDAEDLPKILKYKWCARHLDYVCTTIDGKKTTMHRMIMNCPDDLVVDHINRNPLDNRKENLRICTQGENSRNKSRVGLGKNSRMGVSYRSDREKWRAYITVDDKQISLGNFLTEDEAIHARELAEIKYFGKFK
jgi:hypothetical protein